MQKKTTLSRISLFMLVSLVSCLQVNAQNTVSRCGTMQHHQWKMQNDSHYAKAFSMNEQYISRWIAENKTQRSMMLPPDTIPVVVHVVYNTATENISDAQVFSQIQALNDDYGRKNADSVNTPAVWQPIAGAMPYYFVLARQDASGAPTNGIVRKQTSATSFGTNDAVKFDAQGGSDSWNTNTYLNIWVCDLGQFLLGYGEFPTSAQSNTFGFVCHYLYFGTIGTATAPYNKGRTATHEIGHCFNLFHIWGDDGNACNGSDQVADTPNQGDENYGCPSFPAISCTNGPDGDMFMNYMDYSDDACMNLFTQGQTTRMTAAINTFYPTIVNSLGIQYPSTQANDASAFGIISPTGSSCNTTVTPVITLRNNGTAGLTSVNINYRIDANSYQVYPWSGTLASFATVNVTLPALSTVAGAHTFDCYTSLPNGVADPNSSNDSSSSSFTVTNPAILSLPFTEAFTTASFPPTGWSINNVDNDVTWDRSATSYNGGTGSMWMDNYNYNAWGEVDETETPNFDLTSVTNPQLTFYLAYRLYTDPADNPNYSDTLEVLISTDCGLTFSSLYKKFGSALTTTTPVWAANSFAPTSNAQWRMETISLAAYATASSVIFKFRNINQYENNLYVDDINLNSFTAVSGNDLEKSFTIFPNPAFGKVMINTGNERIVINTVSIYDMTGKVVFKNTNPPVGDRQIDVSQLANGVYNVQVLTDKGTVNKAITIAH